MTGRNINISEAIKRNTVGESSSCSMPGIDKHIFYSMMLMILKQAYGKAEMKKSVRILPVRNKFLIHLLENGFVLGYTQALLGYKNSATTGFYDRILKEGES